MVLLTILRKMKQKEKEVRLLMLGLDNAGKTTIVKKFCGEDTSEISPTFGFNIKTLEYKGFRLNIWDVGGQKSLRSYWRNYFETTDGLIWVVDTADIRRLGDCKAELHQLLEEERLCEVGKALDKIRKLHALYLSQLRAPAHVVSQKDVEWTVNELRTSLRSVEWDLEDLDETLNILFIL
ncbi:unnamed protein product [Notodromas monacha]|uniref:ADP-ribosylation factor-like protein 2 n=1 Tax=Notodromas monacha TaxID=399045 RepID=A0A7R9GBU9_9CRUS|nr:unnamed protein product [Notodromas monacha]CAG0915428.1 unnamed protein product [Notodromas monacha]